MFFSKVTLTLLASLVSSGLVNAAPASSSSQCVISSSDGVSSCLSSTNILIKGPFTVPKNTVIDMSSLKSGTKVSVSGTITWAKGSLNKTNYLFTIGGSGVTFDGTGATFHGNGQDYWDGSGANGGVSKPKMFRVTTTGSSVIKGITIKNSPIHVFSIGGSDTTFDSITVDNKDGDSNGGHNTDAFDVSASGITIKNAVVHNQDDCLAVNTGSNIQFLNNQCWGGHGISIGSISTGKTVDTVTVSNCTIGDSDNGVRIKTVYEATDGYVKNIKYTDITLSNIAKYGIVIEQDYENGSPTGTPTNGIPISNVQLTNIHGSMKSGAKDSIYILCATDGCSNFTFSKISITGVTTTSCTGIKPSGC